MVCGTSYNELRREALHAERENLLNARNPAKNSMTPYVANALGQEAGPIVAASDYMK